MKAVVIGTRAYRDEWSDTDILCDEEFKTWFKPRLVADLLNEGSDGLDKSLLDGGKPVELVAAQSGSAYELALDYPASCRSVTLAGEEIPCAQLKVIAALKKAHLVNPKKWFHHVREYGYLKSLLGVSWFKPSEWGVEAIYKRHREESKKKKHPKLNQSKDNFFSAKESYNTFDHDSIHVAVAAPRPPAYLSYKGESEEVWCERGKWDAISGEEKLRGVVEEACVLALERSIIPALFGREGEIKFIGEQRAFEYAVMKVSTTITSGWFREWAIENHDRVMAARPKYVDAFFQGLKDGVVKPFSAEKASY